jgi:hypothetical protein
MRCFWKVDARLLYNIKPRCAFVIKGSRRIIKIVCNCRGFAACKGVFSPSRIRAKIRSIMEGSWLFGGKDSALIALCNASHFADE